MRLRYGIILGILVVGTIGFGLAWRNQTENDRLQGQLADARREVAEGHYYLALERLSEVQKARPDWSEAPYLIGLAEQGRDKPLLALSAWKDVPITSEFGVLAATARGRGLMGRGLFSEAEAVLGAALEHRGKDTPEARQALILVLKFQGWNEEIRRLYLETLDDPSTTVDRGIETLQDLWKLDHDPFPIASVRKYLLDVGGPDPIDSRIRLSLANLATRAGRFDEADRLITNCEGSDPEDQAVARARLAWARQADRPDRALRALQHLRGDAAEVEDLKAWFARASGDLEAEQTALENRIKLTHADLPAIDRLAEIATTKNQPEAAAQLRKLKDDRDRELIAYKGILFSDKPEEQVDKLYPLAKALGIAVGSKFWADFEKSAADSAVQPVSVALSSAIPVAYRSGRPLIAGNLCERTIEFTDDAKRSGLAMVFEAGWSHQHQLPETMSGGVALVDYDRDGWLDVYALQGGAFPAGGKGDRLFRNKHDGTFEDVTERSGIAAMAKGYSLGVSVGDVDNDGDPDLFVTRWRSYLLLGNNGDGTFTDVTAAYGLGGDRDWPTSSAFADLDNDGDLDLYVCHYLEWSAENPKICDDPDTGRNFYCTPADYRALPDHLFRNDGGKFVDVTEESGVLEQQGRGLGVVAADLDDDGKIDLYVANDMSANLLFHNLGSLKFEERGYEWGVATSGEGGVHAGMGIACGDLDGDLLPDLIVTNFFNESSTLHQNLGHGFFADHTAPSALAALSRDLLGFGVAMADFDNDGILDVITANGHVNDGQPQYPWQMPVQVLRGLGKGKLADASPTAGPALQVHHLGRGLATGDLDNDGQIDTVVVVQGDPLVYLHNDTKTKGNRFLTIAVEGTKSGKDAVGTKVTVEAKGRRWTCQKFGGGSYQSASDPRIHFGLGDAEKVDSVEIRWPSGAVEKIGNLETNKGYRIVEGELEAKGLPEIQPATDKD